MRKLALLVFLAGYHVDTALAANQAGQFAIFGYGEGEITCATFLRSSGEERRAAEIWLAGFFSAYNMYKSPTGNVFGSAKNDVWLYQMEQRCQMYPAEMIFAAAGNLIQKELTENK